MSDDPDRPPTWMVPESPLTDADRWPLLDGEGAALLARLRDHPHAPRWNHRCGERLDADGLALVRAFDDLVRADPPSWSPGRPPAWVPAFVDRVRATVPFHRERARTHGPAASLDDVPPCDRADLAAGWWRFVPDDAVLDGAIAHGTTGTTTGRPLLVPATPVVAASYLVLLRAALSPHGIDLAGGAGRVAVVNVAAQRHTWTYASVSSLLGGAGGAKVNLDPGAWRHPGDRAAFLDDLDPEVYTGDPLAFDVLAALELRTRPRALVSTASALDERRRGVLAERFGCPVVDRYGLSESGPVAASLPAGPGDEVRYRLLQPRLYVELLDAAGRPVPPGQPGEIVLTGGMNPLLPLLRYRTGDVASWASDAAEPVLVGLRGRPSVVLVAADGSTVSPVDVLQALHDLGLGRFALHQRADRSCRFTFERADEPAPERSGGGGAVADRIAARLGARFGPEVDLTVAEAPVPHDPDGPFRSDATPVTRASGPSSTGM